MPEFVVLTIGTAAPGGAAYRTWAVPREQADEIEALIGRPADEERFQTDAELETSNAIVDSFETPTLTRETT